MLNPAITAKITQHFPQAKLLTKDTSPLMKFFGSLLFFTPAFMTDYLTTVGFNIYYPSQSWVDTHPIQAAVCLLHELVHVHDATKLSRPVFSFLYLIPLILVIPAAFLFLFSWKLALLAMLLCMAPIPAYFRMRFEKRAYFAGLYASYRIGTLKGNLATAINLANEKTLYIQQFKGSAYYFMWPFSNIDAEFDAAIALIEKGFRPFEDEVFDAIDDIISVV